jgi:outer membrane protein assembly factor BamB
MHRKRLVFSLGSVILCFAMLATSLLMNGFAHSHAAGPLNSTMQSHTSNYASSGRSFYDPQNNIYFGITFGSIYALNATTGVQLWQYTDTAAIGCDPNGEHSGISIPWVTRGVIYVNPCDSDTACPSHLVALRVTDGSQIWCSSLPIPPYSIGSYYILAVSQGIIYLLPGIYCGTPSYCNQTLYALSARDGSLLWSYSPPSSMFGARFFNFQLVQGVISISINGEMWSPAGPPVGVNEVCALNASDGSQLWCISGAREIGLVQGVVYAMEGSSLVALQASNSGQIWSYTPTSGSLSQIVVLQNGIYIVINGPSGTSICALNNSDGSVRWCSPTKLSSPSIQVKDGILYASQTPIIQAFSISTGQLLWTNQDGQILSEGTGIVYILTSKNHIKELKTKDGTLLWSFNMNLSGLNCCSLSSGAFYFGAGHSLYALSASTGTLLWSHFTTSTVGLSFQGASIGIAYAELNNTTTGSHTLSAFDASSGALLWKYAIVCLGVYC